MHRYLASFWVKTKKWSIIDRSTIVSGDPVPGNFCYARHGTGVYEVKILLTSDNFDDLVKLSVSADGELKLTKALLPNLPAKKPGVSKLPTKKDPTADLSSVFCSSNKLEMGGSNSIFIPPARKEVKLELLGYVEKLVAALRKSLEDETSQGHVTTTLDEGPWPDVEPQQSPLTQQLPLAETVKTKSINPSLEDLPYSTPEVCDPEILIVGHNIKVSKKFKSKLLRKFASRPTVLTVLHIIGENNLKDMRPRNHGPSTFKTIPEDVMKAVDDFVLSNTKNFEKNKITKTISNLAEKLRNPARDHTKPGNEKAPSKKIVGTGKQEKGKKRKRGDSKSNESETEEEKDQDKIKEKTGKGKKRKKGEMKSDEYETEEEKDQEKKKEETDKGKKSKKGEMKSDESDTVFEEENDLRKRRSVQKGGQMDSNVGDSEGSDLDTEDAGSYRSSTAPVQTKQHHAFYLSPKKSHNQCENANSQVLERGNAFYVTPKKNSTGPKAVSSVSATCRHS